MYQEPGKIITNKCTTKNTKQHEEKHIAGRQLRESGRGSAARGLVRLWRIELICVYPCRSVSQYLQPNPQQTTIDKHNIQVMHVLHERPVGFILGTIKTMKGRDTKILGGK